MSIRLYKYLNGLTILPITLSLIFIGITMSDFYLFSHGRRPLVPFYEKLFTLFAPPENYYTPLASLSLDDANPHCRFSHFYRGSYGVCLMIPNSLERGDLDSFDLRITFSIVQGNGKRIASTGKLGNGMLAYHSLRKGLVIVLKKYLVPSDLDFDDITSLTFRVQGKMNAFSVKYPNAKVIVSKLSEE